MKLFYVIFFFLLISCEKYSHGQRIYTQLCSNCHMNDGSGLKDLIPSIAKSNLYESNYINQVVCKIHLGVNADSLGVHLSFMPSHKKMTDVELTNLINFLRSNFGQIEDELNLIQVSSIRKNCK